MICMCNTCQFIGQTRFTKNVGLTNKLISGLVDRMSATQTVGYGSISGWVKPRTNQICICSFSVFDDV